MSSETYSPQELLQQTAARLREAVVELAGHMQPFPSFMSMTSVQAIELEPPPETRNEWGCVVVMADGEICELELEVIPGPAGPTDVDQVDRYKPLELSTEDYIHFAACALRTDGAGTGTTALRLSLPTDCRHQPLLHWVNSQKSCFESYDTQQIWLALTAKRNRGEKSLTFQPDHCVADLVVDDAPIGQPHLHCALRINPKSP